MAEINHVDDAATQIHHACDGGRCQRDRCDLEMFHDVLGRENRYAGHVIVNGQRDQQFSADVTTNPSASRLYAKTSR